MAASEPEVVPATLAEPRKSQRERAVQVKLRDELGCEMEVPCRAGKIDLLCRKRKLMIEVKEWSSWTAGIGQLLAYGEDFAGFKKRLHLFRAPWSHSVSPKRLQFIGDVCKKRGIQLTLDDSIGLQDATDRPSRTLRDRLSRLLHCRCFANSERLFYSQ